jgi:cytochrome c peroxidase
MNAATIKKFSPSLLPVRWGNLCTLIGVAAISAALIFLVRSPVATVSVNGGVSEYLTGQLIEVPGEPIQPLPSKLDLDLRKVAFGKDLFSDKRLSHDGTVACASCHRPDHGGADDVALSKGLGGPAERGQHADVPQCRRRRGTVLGRSGRDA